MKPPRKHTGSADNDATPVADADEILQIKLWLLGISPMVWRRVLVPASYTLRELHGVFQVAMGWEGIHLFQFSLRVVLYGSGGASSSDVTLAALSQDVNQGVSPNLSTRDSRSWERRSSCSVRRSDVPLF
jgi:hypothetical protein